MAKQPTAPSPSVPHLSNTPIDPANAVLSVAGATHGVQHAPQNQPPPPTEESMAAQAQIDCDKDGLKAAVDSVNAPHGSVGDNVASVPPKAVCERLDGLPIIPWDFQRPIGQDGNVLLSLPKTVMAMDKLGPDDAYEVDMEDVPDAGKMTPRIARQAYVWLTDRIQIVKAGLVRRDAEDLWIATVFRGTIKNYPRDHVKVE